MLCFARNVQKLSLSVYSIVQVAGKATMKVLNVAEKNDAAKNVAELLSRGHYNRRNGPSKFNKIYEFDYMLDGRPCKMVMTSVSGHLLNYEFVGGYKKWNSCNPVALFEVPVSKGCSQDYIDVKKNLEKEARGCERLVVWTDCDREGENIGFEVIQVCMAVKPNLQVFRAKFSEITSRSVTRAIQNLIQPDKRISDAVDVRQELDLRIGAAFTRFQTLRLQKVFPNALGQNLISYGSCQFPTLGFVVERYKSIKNFIPESFWKLRVTHETKDVCTEFSWKRVRLFDKTFCQVLLDKCLENNTATVEKVVEKPKSKWRPIPLDTVELEKMASRKLHITAKETMQIAERLYSKGYISYPRTETNIFPSEIDLVPLVQIQVQDDRWGGFAENILQSGPNPRQGKKTDKAHPPIHPTKYVRNLQGNEQRVYEFVVRHFLACLSANAEGHETIVDIDIAEEKFVANGLSILARNYLDVYPYETWNAKEIASYQQGQTFEPTSLDMTEGETSPPPLLTEADLIALMEKHGIGTDATHAEHIDTIQKRAYVGVDNKYFLPTELGIGLVEGYDKMGIHMSKPHLRAQLESDLKRICEGTREPQDVLQEQLAKYKDVFVRTSDQVVRLDEAIAQYLNEERRVVQNDDVLSNMPEVVGKCPLCHSDLVLKRRRENVGYYVSCMSYPTCRYAVWLPDTITGANVAGACNTCGDGRKMLNFTFTPGAFHPFYPDKFTACIGGCDKHFLETVDIQLPSVTVTEATNQTGNAVGSQTHLRNSAVRSLNTVRQVPNSSRQAAPQQRPHFNDNSYNRDNRHTPKFPQQNQYNISSGNPKCHCNEESILLSVRKEGPNQGREFYKCSKQPSCRFFSWADEHNSSVSVPSQQNIAQRQQQFHNDDDDSNIRGGNDSWQRSAYSPDSNNKVVCHCNEDAVLLVVRKDGPNVGRKFYKCPKQTGSCNYFMWADTPQLSPQQNHVPAPPVVTFPNDPTSEDIPNCHCGTAAKQLTVRKDGPNKGREFYGCSKPMSDNSRCTFFKWMNELHTTHNGSLDSSHRQSQYQNDTFHGQRQTNRSRKGANNGKRKCGICGGEGHNRRNCPQKDDDL